MTSTHRQALPLRLRVARAALLYAAFVSVYLCLGLPAPARATVDERLTWLTLLAVVAAGIFSAVALTRRRRAGWAAAVGVGLLCAHIAAIRAPLLVSRVTVPYAGPAVVIAWLLAASAVLAPVVAMLCCVSLRGWRAHLS